MKVIAIKAEDFVSGRAVAVAARYHRHKQRMKRSRRFIVTVTSEYRVTAVTPVEATEVAMSMLKKGKEPLVVSVRWGKWFEYSSGSRVTINQKG